MRILALVAGLLMAASASAQSPQASPQVTIAESECRNLTVHTPAPDVKYRPGQDAQGRAVAPADLNNRQRFQPPKEFTMWKARSSCWTGMRNCGKYRRPFQSARRAGYKRDVTVGASVPPAENY